MPARPTKRTRPSTKPRTVTLAVVSAEPIERSILIFRGVRVLLDSDLATLYGVTTKQLLQAVRRNSDRFPTDFAFQLTLGERKNLRSQTVTSRLSPSEARDIAVRDATQHSCRVRRSR